MMRTFARQGGLQYKQRQQKSSPESQDFDIPVAEQPCTTATANQNPKCSEGCPVKPCSLESGSRSERAIAQGCTGVPPLASPILRQPAQDDLAKVHANRANTEQMDKSMSADLPQPRRCSTGNIMLTPLPSAELQFAHSLHRFESQLPDVTTLAYKDSINWDRDFPLPVDPAPSLSCTNSPRVSPPNHHGKQALRPVLAQSKIHRPHGRRSSIAFAGATIASPLSGRRTNQRMGRS